MASSSEISVEQLAQKIYNAIRRRSLNAVRDAIVEFLGVVLQDLAMHYCRGFAEVLNYLLGFLVRRFKERVQEWIENALMYGLSVAFGRDDRNRVRDTCNGDREFMDKFVKLASKAAIRQGVKWASKEAVREAVKNGAKEAVKQGTKQVTKQATKQATKQGAKSVAKIVAKGATPWAIAADAAQFGLEVAGHDTAGQVVGATGNVIFGGMAAGAIGGVPGLVIGGIVGGGIWAFGEGLGNAAGSVINWFW